MNILGIGAPFGHDPAAAILVDGRLVAAVEEERFTRVKHAPGAPAVNAIRYCLQAAGLQPSQVEHVAFPWSLAAYRRLQWTYARRNWRMRPDRTLKTLTRGTSSERHITQFIHRSLAAAGMDPAKPRLHFVEHHVAHASSAYHLSGFPKAALVSLDAGGEIASTFFGVGEAGRITRLHEIAVPDSLGLFYSTITDYLGFDRNDGEYKVMGMAPYGNPARFDFSHIIRANRESFHVNDRYIWAPRRLRYDMGKWFSRRMVAEWGPPRAGDDLDDPYTDIAAGTQRVFEDIVVQLVQRHVGETLRDCHALCLAGGCALNVKMNQRLLALPGVERVFVQPASHDAGTALGAATYVASQLGERVTPMQHAYVGPSYTSDEIRAALDGAGLSYERPADIAARVSELLAEGYPVAWFQGRAEWGPRALGNRSILGHPAVAGMSDRINAAIKYRERWRPFCPSLLPSQAPEVLGSSHEAPYMTLSFHVTDAWKRKIPEVVHVDGTARPQIVDPATNPTFHRLLTCFEAQTGLPVVLNTSLNRRGEPMACSPQDAINILAGSELTYLAIGDYLVTKP